MCSRVQDEDFSGAMIKRRRDIGKTDAALKTSVQVKVRFSEVDSMQVVWHGEYVRYFEDGREAFGNKYKGIGYLDFYANGYTAPIVDLQLQYLRPLTVNDTATVEIRYIETAAAKLCFEYEIRRDRDGEVAARGSSVQVFVDSDGNMCLQKPQFYEEWERRWLKR